MDVATGDSRAVTGQVRIRTLLVDDTPDVRALLKMVLEASGSFEVVAEAEDGAVGVELVGQLTPDLAVVDLSMPQMDGLTAVPLMKERSPATRIVVMSAFEYPMAAPGEELPGVDSYLEKGAAPTLIVASLLAVCGRSPAGGNSALVAQAAPTVVDRKSAVVEPVKPRDDWSQARHEFLNDLAAISGYAELMADPAFSDVQRRDFAGRIGDNVKEIRRLLDTLDEMMRVDPVDGGAAADQPPAGS